MSRAIQPKVFGTMRSGKPVEELKAHSRMNGGKGLFHDGEYYHHTPNPRGTGNI
jgi:hypothetical protein